MILKKIKYISIVAILIALMSACNGDKKEDHTSHNHGDEKGYYTCSMDPQVKEDKPGKCPICHMDLTHVKGHDTNPNEIRLSQQQIELGNITMQNIAESQMGLNESYTGILVLNQKNLKTVAARASGRIEKLYFKTIGENVAKNQAVYELYSEDIAVAKEDYRAAYKQLSMPGDFGKNAANLLNAAKQKLIFFGLTNSQIENLKTDEPISPYTIFYSPYSGTISEILGTEGSYVMEGMGIIKLANLNSLWLETQVNVNYAKSLKLGQSAKVTFTDFPDKIVNATVTFINPEINSDSRLLLIRLEIPNENLRLKPGMQAVAKLTQANMKGLFIPTDALIREENATYIWIEKTTGIFENLMVKTGMEHNGMIEIKTALDTTKRIVITGAYAIDSEYKFRKGSNPMEGMDM